MHICWSSCGSTSPPSLWQVSSRDLEMCIPAESEYCSSFNSSSIRITLTATSRQRTMSHLSEDGVRQKCQELVYQVAYSFYDAPYIILLNLMVHFGVSVEHHLLHPASMIAAMLCFSSPSKTKLITWDRAREKTIADTVQLPWQDTRKYLGMLQSHRLIKRCVFSVSDALTEADWKIGGSRKSNETF